MSNQNQPEVVELETADTHYWADMLDALERLEQNPDFQKVIQKGFILDKAMNGVSLLARDDVKKRGERPDVMEELVGISILQDFLFTVKQLGTGARQDLAELYAPDTEE